MFGNFHAKCFKNEVTSISQVTQLDIVLNEKTDTKTLLLFRKQCQKSGSSSLRQFYATLADNLDIVRSDRILVWRRKELYHQIRFFFLSFNKNSTLKFSHIFLTITKDFCWQKERRILSDLEENKEYKLEM